MATTGVLSHTGSDGSDFNDRAVAAGYPNRSFITEFIAESNSDAALTFDMFINDPPHRSYLSDPGLTQLGVALVMRGDVGWWSIEFGRSAEGPSCDTGNTPTSPVLAAIGNISVTAGRTLTKTIFATGGNGNALYFRASSLPPWTTFVDHGNGHATLTLSPPSDVSGQFLGLTFTVSDGSLSSSETITVTVAANRAPVLANISNWTVPPDSSSILKLSAIDPDGDQLTYSAAGLPSFVTLQDNGDGTATLTASPTTAQMGRYTGTMVVSDGLLSDSKQFPIAVSQLCLPGIGAPSLAMITLTNRWRSSQGLKMLASDPRLEAAALAHATDMATAGVLSHTGSDGSDPIDRAVAAGYTGPIFPEFVAKTNSDAAYTFDLFINEPLHLSFLSEPRLTQLGVALVMRGDVGWWSIEFGGSAQGPSCDAFLNQPPMANAGEDQSGHLAGAEQLNGRWMGGESGPSKVSR
jgi:uncharacterized protein YkwD